MTSQNNTRGIIRSNMFNNQRKNRYFKMHLNEHRMKMADIYKETQCTKCQHQAVCMYKETFLKAAEAVDRAVMCAEIIEVDESDVSAVKARYAKVTSLPFLWPIKLQCKYYVPQYISGAMRCGDG